MKESPANTSCLEILARQTVRTEASSSCCPLTGLASDQQSGCRESRLGELGEPGELCGNTTQLECSHPEYYGHLYGTIGSLFQVNQKPHSIALQHNNR